MVEINVTKEMHLKLIFKDKEFHLYLDEDGDGNSRPGRLQIMREDTTMPPTLKELIVHPTSSNTITII